MSLNGKLVAAIEIKSDGDVFHELFRNTPHQLSTISPHKIHGFDIHEGEFGAVGSVMFWNYTHDGNRRVAKEVIEAIDEVKKFVTFKVIGGYLLALYKHFVITIHVETAGESNWVNWTFDFEKLDTNSPYPFTLMEVALDVTKEIEAHHLQ